MVKLDRQNQSSIFRNLKKIGWSFSIIALIVMGVGLTLCLIYGIGFYQERDYEQFTKIKGALATIKNTQLGFEQSKVDNIYNAIQPAILTLNSLRVGYFNNFILGLNLFIVGGICFLCVRMIINIILIFRAWDDKMTIIESNSLFITRVVHLTLIIVCQAVIVTCSSFLVPQFILNVTQDFNDYLNSLSIYLNSLSIKFNSLTNDSFNSTLIDAQTKLDQIQKYYFISDTKLAQFKPIIDAVVYPTSEASLSYPEIRKLLDPIINKEITPFGVSIAAFTLIWMLLVISNTITSIIIIDKFDYDNDRYTPKKMMFNNKESRTSYYI